MIPAKEIYNIYITYLSFFLLESPLPFVFLDLSNYFFNFGALFNTASSAAPQISLCQRALGLNHRVHILVEMKQGQCICPLSWSVHCNFTGEGKCSEGGWAGVHPPPLPARANFTLITECTPESSGCNSVYSVD